MTLTDPLGDMLTRIRNAQMRKRNKVSTPASFLRERVLHVLKAEGYIRDFVRVDVGPGISKFEIALKYFDGAAVIRHVKRVSKPGQRVYSSVKSLPCVANGLGVCILSTSRGVMPDHEARGKNVGGEILCQIF
ncbi:MAG: 30S ribosomal protein S8 [Alphaproteobacteria bacterium]|nr:30S ribosomal protein S8 [Alphaproteobacteria bacterium]